ncbi:MAG: 1-acyl-sn-glycerol-3-phosphate acyltransferase [Pseudohongiellaceae bacterium]|jgi:1-acyl-sn-glycerol-3-phosphate acyltransferase
MIFKNYRVDSLARQTWGNHFHWGFVTGVLRAVLRSVFRVSTADIKTVPEGALIVAPNHRSFLDPALVGSLLDRRVIFMMHAKYYDSPKLNWCYRMARCIVVEGEGDNRKALRDGKAVLEAGHALCIFPEGTISPDGEPQAAQPGMAWLARKTGAPILPVHVGGTREALTKGRRGVRFSPITVRVGELIDQADFVPGRAGAEALTASVMEAIADLAPPSE